MSNEVSCITNIVSGEWLTDTDMSNKYNNFIDATNKVESGNEVLDILKQYSRQAVENVPSIIMYPHKTYEPLYLRQGALLILEMHERVTADKNIFHRLVSENGKYERELAKCFFTFKIHAPHSQDDILGKDHFSGGETYCGEILTGRYRYSPHKL